MCCTNLPIRRRVFVTGDTHAWTDIDKLNPLCFPEGNKLTRQDLVIITGDAGIIFYPGSRNQKILEWYESRPWTTVYCDGNHEGFDYLNQYESTEFLGAKAHKLSDHIYHIRRGEIMTLEDGRRFLFFGGAVSQDYDWRSPGYDWFPQELPVKEELDNALANLERAGNRVDYVITHDVPTCCLRLLGFRGMTFAQRLHYPPESLDIQYVLDQILYQTDFRVWFAGHYHINREMETIPSEKGILQILYDDIVECRDGSTEDGKYMKSRNDITIADDSTSDRVISDFRLLPNFRRRFMNCTYTREEMCRILEEENLFFNHHKLAPDTGFGVYETAERAADCFHEDMKDTALAWLTEHYNQLRIRRATRDVLEN